MAQYQDAMNTSPAVIERVMRDRQMLTRRETENFLRALTLKNAETIDEQWARDYSSLEKYAESVAPHREAWANAVGLFDLTVQSEPKKAPFFETDRAVGYILTVELDEGFCARAALAIPKGKEGPFPLIIAQHGISSSPERVFGFIDNSGIYYGYGMRLVEAGYVVLAPLHITEIPARSRQNRLCLMLGKTLFGLEISKLKRLLDVVTQMPEVNADAIGMWGISLGGAYTIFTTPIEQRIKAAIITAWFNHRVRKMVIDDPRHSCFLSTQEEYVFIPGWLTRFRDSDLISLICPRPVMVQHGKADGIGWWPWIMEEFEESKRHYDALGIGDRIVMDLHEGGHEIDPEVGIAFMDRYLKGIR